MSDVEDGKGVSALVGAVPGLLRRMREAGVTSLDVRAGSARLAMTSAAGPGAHGGAEVASGEDDDGMSGLHALVSPLAGVAYLSPGPEQPPYVKVGEEVAAGQVVAIVEAMKVFNEIHADRAGRVVRVGVTPGAVVRAGTPLLYLRATDSHATFGDGASGGGFGIAG